MTSLWNRTFARPCPVGAPASDCLATLPGRVESRFDDYAEGDVSISLEIPDASADTVTSYGHSHAVFTPRVADRLGITSGSHNVPVTVTLFDTGVVALTGPNGETAETESGVGEAFFHLLLTSGAAILVVAGGGYLWRRFRGGTAGWIRRAGVSATVGVFAGVTAGAVVARALGAAWVMPTTFAVTLVVGVAVTFVRLPRFAGIGLLRTR